eukprot:TRINITY_DN3255_c0_g1_i2.p1 TRINITY_DN3255_c0_g1~~TRINITY_DN3255_c0_g1_i2.p1  ORF type:complete len:533 (-),score=64.97 TRINITY_DN3255_c0_g1_i2:20-1618(-)
MLQSIREKRTEQVKILVLGSVAGNVDQACARILNVNNSKAGPFDVVFCVGSFLDVKQDAGTTPSLASIMDYIEGRKQANLPMVFLDSHREGLDDVSTWGNLTRLAGCGVTLVHGLTVGYNSLPSTQPLPEGIQDEWVRLYPTGIDLLLTSDWPSGVLNNVKAEELPRIPAESLASLSGAGTATNAQIAMLLQPRYHFAGHCAGTTNDFFYERAPYSNPSAVHVTRFLSIASLTNTDKQKYLYAANLAPLVKMDQEVLGKKPNNTTPAPYDLQRLAVKSRPPPTISGTQPPNKRQRGPAGGAEGGKPRRESRAQRDSRPLSDACWFCLSSPQIEKHMIVSVGRSMYVATARGPLVPEHLLIIPVNHVASSLQLSEAAREELQKYKKSLREYFASKSMSVFFFTQMYNPSHHAHIQVIPLSDNAASHIRGAFEAGAEAHGVRLSQSDSDSLESLIDGPHFVCDLPTGEILYHNPRHAKDRRLPFQFAREVLADALEVRERGDWKACEEGKEGEMQSAAAFKQAFRPFDWALVKK